MINSTNSDYSVSHESELAYVLSKFNNDFVYTTVNESLGNRLRNVDYTSPNIVKAFEENFNITKEEFPDNIGEITDVRNETYANIIRILCDYYNLVYNDNDSLDIFKSASMMYSFLVSNFQQNIVTFFVNYILKEKSAIYQMCELSSNKKSKDTGTIYSKKIFKDPKIALISANLESVISNICGGFDISFETYLAYVYEGDIESYNILSYTLSPTIDFFKMYIAPVFNSTYGSVILTSIRLAIQHNSSDILDMNNIIKEKEE